MIKSARIITPYILFSLELMLHLIMFEFTIHPINLNLTKIKALWTPYVKQVIISHTIDPLVDGTQIDGMIGLALIIQNWPPQE